MPFYHAPLPKIDMSETRRYAGLRGAVEFPEQLLEQACNEALLYVKSRGCWQSYHYAATSGTILSQPSYKLEGEKVLSHLEKAVEIAVLAVTIGPELEQAVSERFAAGEYTFGLLLDAAGTTAVESIADAVNAVIADQAARRGLRALSRFSPGYGDWDIVAQPEILTLSGGRDIEIAVTPSCMLVPRKSVTAVIGLAAASEGLPATNCKPEGCKNCSQQNCPARKETSEL